MPHRNEILYLPVTETKDYMSFLRTKCSQGENIGIHVILKICIYNSIYMKKKYDRKSPAIIKAVQKKDDLLKMLLKVNLHYWMWPLKLRHMIKLCGKPAMSHSS